MNQELEQKVNQVIIEQEVSPSEALIIVQQQEASKAAEETLENTEESGVFFSQNGEDQNENTSSEPSAGTFEYIGSPNIPEAPSEESLRQMNPVQQAVALDRYKKDYEAAVSVGQENQALLDREWVKLQELAYRTDSAEERQALYNTFTEETGIPITADNFSSLEGDIVKAREEAKIRDEKIQGELMPLMSEAIVKNSFIDVEDFLVENNSSQEYIDAVKKYWRAQSEEYNKRKNSAEYASGLMNKLYSSDQLRKELSKLSDIYFSEKDGTVLSGQEAVDAYVRVFEESLERVGGQVIATTKQSAELPIAAYYEFTEGAGIEGMDAMVASLEEEISEELGKDFRFGTEVSQPDRNFTRETFGQVPMTTYQRIEPEVQELITELYNNRRAAMLSQKNEAEERLKELDSIYKEVPELKTALALHTTIQSRMGIDEKSSEEERKKAKEEVKKALRSYTKEQGLDKDEVKALENAMRIYTYENYDLDGDGFVGSTSDLDSLGGFGAVNYTVASASGGVLLGIAELFPAMARGGAYARTAFDEVMGNTLDNIANSLGYMSDEVEQEREILNAFIEKAKDDNIAAYLTPDLVGWYREQIGDINYEKGILDSFRSGDYLSGFLQSVEGAADALPLTLATLVVSTVATPAAGMAFASGMAASMEFESVRNEDWYNEMGALGRSTYLTGIAVLEGGSELIGGGVAGRLATGSGKRLIGESLGHYGRRAAKDYIVDVGMDAVTEMGVEFGNAGLQYLAQTSADDRSAAGLINAVAGVTDDAIESGIISVFMSNGMSIGGTGVKLGGRVLSGTEVGANIISAFGANVDPDYIVHSKDFQQEITSILQNTAPGSKTRAQQIEQLVEKSSFGANLKADSFEVLESIRRANPEAAVDIAKNNAAIAKKMAEIQNSTSPSQMKSLRAEIEQLIVENQSITKKTMESGALTASDSNQSVKKLQERSKLFSRQANRLEAQGRTEAAKSLRSKVERIGKQIDGIQVRSEINKGIVDGSVITTKGRDASFIADAINGTGTNGIVVDEAIAEKLKEAGYSEVAFDGSGDAKLMVKGAAGLKVDTKGMSVSDAINEVTIAQKQKNGSLTSQEVQNSIVSERVKGRELSPLLKELEAGLSESERLRIEERVEKISQRTERDILDPDKEAAPATMSEENNKLTEQLKKATGVQSDKVRVISEAEAYRKKYEEALTEDQKQSVLEEYLSGEGTVGGYYDRVTGEVFISETATAKDIVEEFAHATIHQKLHGFNGASKKFKADLLDIMNSDPEIARDVEAKILHYSSVLNMHPDMLLEEAFVEVFASYVANEMLVLEQTKSSLDSFIDRITPGFLKSGGQSGSVMRKLASSLRQDIVDETSTRTAWEELFAKEQLSEEASDIETNQSERPEGTAFSSKPGPRFLDNKEVTFSKVNMGQDFISRVYAIEKKTFNDYFHFVNWYRKMTGNGQYTRIGSMQYVDDSGAVKSLRPPKPLIDKTTGSPVIMEPVMKSWSQQQMEKNRRAQEKRDQRNRREVEANQSVGLVVDQVHDIIGESMRKSRRGGWAMGNTTNLINELMEDWTLDGTPKEGVTDKYGRPIVEKVKGTPEYKEELLARTNDWLEANYPGEVILFSSSSNRRSVNALFTASAGLTSDQKRKNIDRVIKRAVNQLGLNSPIMKELLAYQKGLPKGKLGRNTPRALVNALLVANDTYYLSKVLQGTNSVVSKEHVLDMYLRKLVAFDKLFDNRGRDFFKTTKEAIDSLALAAGKKPMPTGQGGVMLVENEQLAELSQKHKNLLTAILAVTSNGSKAEINLTEAIVIYSVIINEMQDEHTKKIESGEFTEGSKEEKKWLKSWNGGGRIAARLELVEGNDKHTVTKFTPDRAVNIANSLRKLIELYDFSNPNQFKKTLKKEVPQNAEGIKVGAQNIFGRKIGAFMMNLLGDASVITQDLHVVESLDRVFRPVNGYSVNISALRELMKSQMDMSESEIAKVEESWLYESKENADGSSERIYDIKKVKRWLKNKGAKKIQGVCGKVGGNTAIVRFIEKELNPKKKPGTGEGVQNDEIITQLHEKLTSKKEDGSPMYPGYSRASLADVGQMIFLENHAAQNAFGASSRTYEDFHGSADNAIAEWESNLVAGMEDISFTEKFKYLSRLDKTDIIDDGAFQEMQEKLDKNQLTPEEIIYFNDLKEFRDKFPETVNQLARIEMMDSRDHSPVFFSSKKQSLASDHPQANVFDVSSVFSGRQVSSLSNVRIKKSAMDLNKLLEGRADELDLKARTTKYSLAEEFEGTVNGVMFVRHPLHSETFVDSYGNRLREAESALVSGNTMIVSGKIKLDPPLAQIGRDFVDVTAPEHHVAFQNFVSVLTSRNRSLSGSSIDMFESAYNAMTAKDRARFANLTIDEHGNVIKGRRLRGTSKRLASSSEFGRFKNEIINNPNNYIDQQKIAKEQKALEQMSPQELVSLMRGDALNNLATRNDDVGVLAGIELINRMQEEGNDIGIVSVLDQLAAVGTTAGRVLRHMAELKTSTPQGMANVIIKKAQEQGKILSEAQKNKILEATKAYMDAYRAAQNLMERGIAGEDVEAEFKKAQDVLDEAQRDLDTLANMFIEKKWSEIGVQLVQGNLLTMMSQARNVVYNLANVIPKTVIDLMSMPTSRAFELMGLHKEQRKLSLAGYLYAMRKFGAGAIEAIEQVITGREKDMSEWRMSRGFMPIRSLMAAMSSELPEGQSLRDEFNQRAKLLVQGTFGIPAEAMFRLLSLGDVPFRRFAEGLELYSLGRGKGLEGDALAQFLKFPDKDSMERSATEGRKLTFQEPMGLAKGSMWVIDNLSRGMGQAFSNVKGFDGEGFFKFLIRLNVPYVSTIANFTEETLTYASPVFGGGKMAIQMSNGEYTEASKTLSKVMVGQAVSSTALYLISQGLLSGSIDWEDDEKTNLMYDTFPPNSINVSGLRRLLNGEDPAPQAGDEFRSYQTLGVLGTIMGAYAHTTTPDAAKEMADQPLTANSVLKKLFGFDNASVVAYMMDQSFLQGLNGITSLIASTKDPDDFEKAFFKYVETISKACSSMFLPNVLSGIDQSTREFMPDKRDVDLTDRIKNHVKERTFNTGGLPVKVNWKGERIEQAPEGGNQFAYYMFDALKSRQASQDEVSIEILNLYLETGVLPKAVGTPYYASSVYRKLNPPSVSRGKAKKAYEALGRPYNFLNNPEEDFFVRLTAEEINNALAMSNTLRYEDIKSFMQTDDYKSMTPNEKVEALDEINDRYKSLLSYNPDGSFMEHSKYILEVMEQRYLEQYGQD